LKTKNASQRADVDATPVGSAEISPDVTLSGDHIASLDAKRLKKILNCLQL